MSTIVTRAGKGSPLTHVEVDQNWTNLNADKLEVGAAFNAAVAATPAVTANTAKVTNATHTGDVTGATALTLATVNSNVGAFGSATQVATFTVNAKGLTTAAANVSISIPMTAISDSTAAGRAVLGAATATAQTALFDVFTSGAKGLAPASGGGTTNFLRADGTWAAPGGGGSGDVVGPGAATDNALARFDMTTGKLIQNSVNPVSDAGEIGFPAVASPATPASGTVNLYGTDAFGPTRLGFLGPDGKLRLLQNDLGEFSVQRFQPAAGLATMVGENSINAVLTGTGTSAGAVITNLHRMKPRLDVLVTTASTTAIAAIRPNGSGARMVRVGRDANAPGGFLARFVWGPATGVSNASHRAFCGLDGTTNVPTDVENSGLTTGIVGMGWDAADTNIQIMHNDLAGVATKIDLGSSFPVPTTDRSEVYELQLYSPNSLTQSVSYRVIRYNTTDNTIFAEATGTLTTNLPPVGTLLAPAIRMSVGGVSSVVGIACMGILIGREY